MQWMGRGDRLLGEGNHWGIMAILNITPDSFSDGGQWINSLAAFRKGQQFLAEGAHVIDIGAESTRPGATPVPQEKEAIRLRPVLEVFNTQLPGVAISVDTRNSKTAFMALANGAAIINDVSGLRHDPFMVDVLADFKPGYVLTHSQGDPATMQKTPHYGNVVDEILDFFEKAIRKLTQSGLPENRIILDPGIGFGKTISHNLEIIKNMSRFLIFDRPILVGISRKSLFGQLLNLPVHERDRATAVATALLYERGASWHRVHDVNAAREALILSETFMGKDLSLTN